MLMGGDTWSLESLKVKMLQVYERNRETDTSSKRRMRMCWGGIKPLQKTPEPLEVLTGAEMSGSHSKSRRKTSEPFLSHSKVLWPSSGLSCDNTFTTRSTKL